ncbi:MAG: hypothetical protein M3395_10070 [Chloroflexota bacterium]|nr:hypothetical protein [Chloroflexota bacterium]
MSGHIRPDDDRDLDVWVQEVTESWRLPRLRSDQLSWQARIGRSGSRTKFAGLSGARVVGALGTAAAVALVSVMLVSSLPIAPSPGPGGRSTDAAASASPKVSQRTLGEGSDEKFKLTIRVDRGRYGVDEPIEIATTLSYLGDEPATVTSSGGGLVSFHIVQLDGPVDVEAVRTADCMQYEYRPGDRESVEYQKSGGYSADDPMADFWRRFFADPELRLPAGEYRIIATADYGAPECGEERTIQASVVIVVE